MTCLLYHLQEPETPSITLASGEVIKPDLVVAADGIHSIAVEAVLGAPNPPKAEEHYNCCYRFLIPASVLESDPETSFFNTDGEGKMRIFADNAHRKRLVCYPCRKYGPWLVDFSKIDLLANHGYLAMKYSILSEYSITKTWKTL